VKNKRKVGKSSRDDRGEVGPAFCESKPKDANGQGLRCWLVPPAHLDELIDVGENRARFGDDTFALSCQGDPSAGAVEQGESEFVL